SIVDGYARSLDWALGHQRLMLVLFILTIAFTIFLYIKVPKTFFPEEDTGLVIGRTLAAPDVSFDRMKRLQSRVVQIIRKDPAIATISSSVGVTNGFSSANRGTMFIGLKPASKRSQPAKLVILDLERKLDEIPGIHVYLQIAQDLFFGGQSNGGEYSFSVLDPSFASLDQITERIVRRLKTLKSINTVSTDLNRAETQITVDINRIRAARLGVSVAAIDAALGEAFGQRPISRIYEAQNQYEVVLTVGAARARHPPRPRRHLCCGSLRSRPTASGGTADPRQRSSPGDPLRRRAGGHDQFQCGTGSRARTGHHERTAGHCQHATSGRCPHPFWRQREILSALH
ncbi:acriflavin resistance protein, partial [mine drainage metagenome]